MEKHIVARRFSALVWKAALLIENFHLVIWSCSGDKMATPQQIETKNVRGPGNYGVWTTYLLVPGHSVLSRAPSMDAALVNFQNLQKLLSFSQLKIHFARACQSIRIDKSYTKQDE